MWAVLSDIHANLEALDAVLADIAKHHVSRIFCLGDVLGYGPDPVACLEKAMAWDVTLLGNHDQAVLVDPDGFCESAEKAIFWTQSELESTTRRDLWDFLTQRPLTNHYGDFLFVHGSARNPLNEYVFPEDVENLQKKLERIFALVPKYCFQGHTHIPGIFTEAKEFLSPEQVGFAYRLDERKVMVNVGAVGQPRDHDWRASYVLVDGRDVIFRRVEYDVDTTVRKIYAIPELDNFLGDRLREGR